VGYGSIGRLYHEILSAPTRPIDLEVTAIADPQRLGSVGTPSLDVYQDYRRLLDRGVEVVLIATPPSTHFAIARHALEAGAHVLVEKPATHSRAHCDQLVAVSESAGRVLFFAYHARYAHSVAVARERLAEREVRSASAVYREDVLRFHSPDSWVHSEGVLWDSGINALSVLTHVLPEVTALRATEARVGAANDRGGESSALVRGEVTTAGHVAVLELDLDSSYTGPEERRFIVETSEGTMTLDLAADALFEEGTPIVVPGAEPNSLRREYQYLLAHFATSLSAFRSECGCGEIEFLEKARYLVGRAPSSAQRDGAL